MEADWPVLIFYDLFVVSVCQCTGARCWIPNEGETGIVPLTSVEYEALDSTRQQLYYNRGTRGGEHGGRLACFHLIRLICRVFVQCQCTGASCINARAAQRAREEGISYVEAGGVGASASSARAAQRAREEDISYVEAGGTKRGKNVCYRRWRNKTQNELLPEMSYYELEKLLGAPRNSLLRAPLKYMYEYAETKEEFQARKKAAAAAARKESRRAKKKRVEANCNADGQQPNKKRKPPPPPPNGPRAACA